MQSDPEFTRHDWSIYISNLPQRAGVPLGYIRGLVLKELVGNALDEMDRVGRPGRVTLSQDAEHTYTVTDEGRGFSDTPEELAYYIGSTSRDESVRIFAMIDADAHGSMIFQTLVEETKARGARNIEITNLGLFPWEGLAEGLQYESGLIEQARKKDKYRRAKVVDYILERDRRNMRTGNPDNEPDWQEWLQDNRIELNAMTSPQRVAWVERKFAAAGIKKVIPPQEIALQELDKKVREEISRQVTAEALRDKSAWINQEMIKRTRKIKLPTNIAERIDKYLAHHRSHRWTQAIQKLTFELT